MSRLIDADALEPKFVHGRWDDTYVSNSELINAPTITPDMAQVLAYECGKNAVSVVRCKDCKRWDGVPADETQDHECHLFDGNEEKIRIATPSYWFCPAGERRSE